MIEQSVGDVMTRSVRTIAPATTACEVAVLFAEHDIGSAVVVTPETERPIGIVTDSDLLEQVAAGADIESIRVDSFMTAPLVTITSTDDIHTAAALMKDQSIQGLPVIDDGDLVGIVTTTDLTHYIPRLRNTILRGRNELAGH